MSARLYSTINSSSASNKNCAKRRKLDHEDRQSQKTIPPVAKKAVPLKPRNQASLVPGTIDHSLPAFIYGVPLYRGSAQQAYETYKLQRSIDQEGYLFRKEDAKAREEKQRVERGLIDQAEKEKRARDEILRRVQVEKEERVRDEILRKVQAEKEERIRTERLRIEQAEKEERIRNERLRIEQAEKARAEMTGKDQAEKASPSKKIYKTEHVKQWTSQNVVAFLVGISPAFIRYSDSFIDNEIDGKAFLVLLNVHLVDLGVTIIGHKAKILDAIRIFNSRL